MGDRLATAAGDDLSLEEVFFPDGDELDAGESCGIIGEALIFLDEGSIELFSNGLFGDLIKERPSS